MLKNQLAIRPTRSLQPSQCKQIEIESNHFQIVFEKQMLLHLYSYHFSEPIPMDDYRQISSLLNSAKREIKDSGLKKFSLSGSNIWSEYCQHEDIVVEGQYFNKNTLIKIKFVKTIDLSDSTQFKDPQSIACLQQAANALLKQIYRERGMFEMFGRGQFFNKMDGKKVPNYNIKILTGFNCTVIQGEKFPLLQIDFKTKLLNCELVHDYFRLRNLKDKYVQDDLQMEFKNKYVMTIYSKRIYRIKCIDFNARPTDKMSGSNKTFQQYYYEQYRIKITDLKQPLLVHQDKRTKKIIMLIPELLYMAGLTLRQLNDFNLKKEIKNDTILPPQQKQYLIKEECRKLGEKLKDKNIKIIPETTVPGQKMMNPIIVAQGQVVGGKGGCFDIVGNFIQNSEIVDWILIFNQQEIKYAKELEQTFIEKGNKHGIKIKKSFLLSQSSYNSQDWILSLQKEFQKSGKPQIVISIMDKNKDKKLYAELKKFLIGREGVPHQNVAIQTLSKSDTFRKIASKILLQIHSKLGKQVWNISQIQEIDEDILVIGIDVYHKTIDGNQSCVGFNAQFGQQSDQNYTKTLLVKTAQEINSGVGNLLDLTLDEYYKYKKYLPKSIVIFRDGVGNTQIEKLIKDEINIMQEVIQKRYNIKSPKFAYIMVNKRINDKFFTRTQDNYGIVVSDRVVSQNFDYFLIAQQVNQGTPTPTHYTVLVNTTDWKEETFWKFTYYQCYNYRNWSGPVKIPACVQNAHTVAYRIGDVIKSEASYYLERQLYFL